MPKKTPNPVTERNHRLTVLGGLVLVPALFLLLAIGCGGGGEKLNVILITLDTTRADHLGCYGYERDTSPAIDALARDGLIFTRAYSTSSWTLPAHASLFTAKYPTTHGAQYDPDGPLQLTQGIEGPESWSRYRARDLSRDEVTLADLLKGQGYETGAVVAGPWMKKIFGLDKGFDFYDDSGIDSVNGKRAWDVTTAAVSWIRDHEDDPFFLFLNYYDPHGPFDPPEETKWTFIPPGVELKTIPKNELLIALYDAEILYTDRQVGRLIEELERLGLKGKTLIVLTSDHGELLGDNGEFGHGASLTQAEIRVPLIVSDPDPAAPRGTDHTPVQITGVLPMITKRLGISAPDRIQGRPLPEPSGPVFAEVYPLPIMGAPDWQTIVEGDLKYARNGAGKKVLINVEEDPKERRNLIDEHPEKARELAQTLDRFLAGLPRPRKATGPVRTIDGATREALENLGYLEKQEEKENQKESGEEKEPRRPQ